ncbi:MULTISPECIES: hypothetical protein [Arenibacter]|uniref:hypothetical protein n=1 Tax=Arenibacter TaxID=178469 RepID=UPI0004DF36C7|nr:MULTISPECIES: hypothetical protein [Arenibacter]
MKYAIITTIITALGAILLLFIDTGLTKNDKSFIITILVILFLSGVYFSIKDIREKKLESVKFENKLDGTLNNTENIKLKADKIISNLDESLEEALKISDSIKGFNKTLGVIEQNVSNQIRILNKTLKQTEIFERKVQEQLTLDKARFALEKADIIVYGADVMLVISPRDSSKLSVEYKLYNSGKRSAININHKFALIGFDNNDSILGFETSKEYEKGQLKGDIAAFEKVTSFPFLPLNSLDSHSSIVLIIKLNFKDESDNEDIQKNFFFQWTRKQNQDHQFYSIKDNFRNRCIKYIKEKNIDILID